MSPLMCCHEPQQAEEAGYDQEPQREVDGVSGGSHCHSYNQHVVVVPFPAQGHIRPLMELSKKLAQSSPSTLLATVVNTEHNHERLMASGTGAGARLPPNLRLAAIPDGLPRDHPRAAPLDDLCHAIAGPMAASLVALLGDLATPRPTCLVLDLSLPFCKRVARDSGLPWVAFWTRSASYLASVRLFCEGIWPPTSHHGEVDACDLSSYIFGAAPIRHLDMSPPLLNDPHDFMYNFITRPIYEVNDAMYILIHTFEALEASVVKHLLNNLRILCIGPLLPPTFLHDAITHVTSETTSLWQEEHHCLDWLDKQANRSVIYVSFGSITIWSEMQIEEFLLGLELSKMAFLWVWRPDMARAPQFNKIFQRMKGRALCVAWAPQLKVLSHKAVGAFVMHGGWNSILEAITCGVPMVGLPYFADQKANCRCISDGWKIGLSFEENEEGLVTKEEVCKKIIMLTHEVSSLHIRQRLDTLMDEVRKALSENGSSYKSWGSFLHTINASRSILN